jgi:hypothetical protein
MGVEDEYAAADLEAYILGRGRFRFLDQLRIGKILTVVSQTARIITISARFVVQFFSGTSTKKFITQRVIIAQLNQPSVARSIGEEVVL